MDVLDSRWVQSELGKSSSRSRGDRCNRDNAATFHAIGSQSSPCGFGLEEEGLSWRSAYEDPAAKTAWKRKNSSCLDALDCSSGDSLRAISQSASQSDADQWLKAWMLCLWLADSVGVYGAVHVTGIVVLSCSARMAFLTPFSMLRISECRLCLCQNAKFEALQHAPSLVIS